MNNLLWKRKMKHKAFRADLVSRFGDRLSYRRYREDYAPQGEAPAVCHLYYVDDTHIGTWVKGSGWILKSAADIYDLQPASSTPTSPLSQHWKSCSKSSRSGLVAEAKGNCYEAAFSFLRCYGRSDPRLRLVHAVVVGQGQIAGLEHGHAWLESTGLALDVANGRRIVLPASYYRELGQATQVHVYTLSEARELALEHEHYGHWELDVEL